MFDANVLNPRRLCRRKNMGPCALPQNYVKLVKMIEILRPLADRGVGALLVDLVRILFWVPLMSGRGQ